MKNSFKNYLLSNHVLLTVLVIALAWFLINVKGIIIEVFIAYIIMAALTPFIRSLREYRIPNAIATAITYIMVLIILIVIIFPLVPFFTSQIQSLIKTFPLYIKDVA